MKRLGELLLARGAVTVSELHTALEMTHRKGGRLGTHLLALGFVEEPALLEALEEQFGVPAVSEHELENVPQPIRDLVPAPLQERLGVTPAGRSGTVLELAMINPLDLAAREAVAEATGMEIRAKVATEAAIHRVVGKTGPMAEGRGAAARRKERRVPPPEAWEGFWSLPPVGPEQLRLMDPGSPPGTSPLMVTFPQLATVVGDASGGREGTLDRPTYLAKLQSAPHRDVVANLLLRHLAHYLDRVALFVVHKDRVVGWSARGDGVLVDDIQSLIIPLDRPSLFVNLRHTGQYYLGPIPPGEANQVLAEALGDPAPQEILALPVRIKGRAVMYALGDSPGMQLAELPVAELADACGKAGLALEVLILRSKIVE